MKTLLKMLCLGLSLAVVPPVFAEPVDINTADVKALADNIRGVGAKKAEAIVKYRQKHGPFKRPEDLAKVRGIGLRLVERNRDVIRVGRPKK